MKRWLAVIPAFAACGCNRVQSVLAANGPEAERVANLFWIMTGAGAVILLGVMALAALAIFGPDRWRGGLRSDRVVIGGGIIFPTIVLSVLLVAAFLLTRAGALPGGQSPSLRIAVVGEQWWWRVRYAAADGSRIESANEIRIPVGRPVALELSTADVIHSLWIPTLAGKLDMIPGRTTVLHVEANSAGVTRAQCAEYCGGAHALMSLYVVAMEQEEFEQWLAGEAAPARAEGGLRSRDGERLFFAAGCAACHTIRGTRAQGTIGPDLTHLGSRVSLAAATLPNNVEAIARWIQDNQHIKPDNKMPPYRVFSREELDSLAFYLAGLK
jgi:cytochrome c oxidase subunit 2